MKKKFICALAFLCLLGLFTGCGDKTGKESSESGVSELILLRDTDVEHIVKLGEYKGLKVTVSQTEVDEEMLNQSVDQLYMSALPYMTGVTVDNGLTDRAVQDGDIIYIDYEGKKDGVAFDGGTAQGSYLAIGSGMFIPGFEEGLIGVMPGSTVDLNLTFPENYGSADLAGAKVVFTVKVNYILPEKYNDRLIEEFGIPEVKTYQQLKDYYREYMQSQIQSEIRDAVLTTFAENCEFNNVPDALVERYKMNARKSFEATATMYGVDVDTYTTYYYGVTLDKLLEKVGDTAKENLALQAVANNENLNITDEELDSELAKMAKEGNYATTEEFLGSTTKEEFRESMMIERVTDFLVKQAVVEKKN